MREEEQSDPRREFLAFEMDVKWRGVRGEDQCHKRSFVFFRLWNGNAAARHLEEIVELRNEATSILIEGGLRKGLEKPWVA